MNIERTLRKLAKSSYWQSVYSNSKELSGMHLFNNKSNFSSIQVNFLYWLKVYSILYQELSDMECPYLTEAVIEDDLRTDAYLYYRNKKMEKELKKQKIESQKSQLSRHKKHTGKNVTPFSVDIQR